MFVQYERVSFMAHKCLPSTMKMFNLCSKIFSNLISVQKLAYFLILNILISFHSSKMECKVSCDS